MAPAHSFDVTTLEVLRNNNINTITDGYGLYPYTYKDILFVPQLFSKPRKMPVGIFTWCLHTNTMSDKDIDDLEIFIKNNQESIISFKDAKKYKKDNILCKTLNNLIKHLVIFTRKIKRNRL